MRTHTRTTTTALALALAVALGGCTGGGGEPTESTSTASGPVSSSTDEGLAATAEDTYRKVWALQADRTDSDIPSDEERALITEEAYQSTVDYAKTAPPTKAEGRDKLLALNTTTKWSKAGPTATIEVCYEVHRRLILTEDVESADGEVLKKGTNIRTDPDDKPIKAGTEMVNLVTMKRGRQDDDVWKLDAVQADYRPKCSTGEKQ